MKTFCYLYEILKLVAYSLDFQNIHNSSEGFAEYLTPNTYVVIKLNLDSIE